MAATESDFPKSAPDQGNPAPNGLDSGELAQVSESPPGSRSVLENFLALGSGIVVSKAVAFIGTAYLARRLGVYGFGVIGFATAVCSYFAIALRGGFGPMGTRQVARQPKADVPVRPEAGALPQPTATATQSGRDEAPTPEIAAQRIAGPGGIAGPRAEDLFELKPRVKRGAPPGFVPVDPFDPEIFNRRYHGSAK